MHDRINYEVEFHNSSGGRQEARSLPARLVKDIIKEAEEYFYDLIEKKCPGQVALDYGCGEGGLTGRLLTWGASGVTGIDISSGMVERAEAVFNNPLARFMVMNGEQMEFADNTFDLVVGSAILHHLDLGKSFREIFRVLKPGGSAVFLEPMGHNVFINLFRKLTPQARTPFEHPLKKVDIKLAGKIFSKVATREFVCLPLMILPFKGVLPDALFSAGLQYLSALDRLVLKCFPFIRHYFWITVLEMKK